MRSNTVSTEHWRPLEPLRPLLLPGAPVSVLETLGMGLLYVSPGDGEMESGVEKLLPMKPPERKPGSLKIREG